MTVIQKQAPSNPIAHLTARGHRGDRPRARRHPRRRCFATLGADDAAYIRKVITAQRKLELGSRAVLLFSLFPPAWLARHRRAVGGQDPGEHGDRPQHPARPVGLDARPEDPLDHLGVGQRRAGRAVEALAQRDPPHVHERGRQGQRPRLRDHARRRGPALGSRSTWASRCGTSSTPASSSTASPPTTSSSARTSSARRGARAPSSRRDVQEVLRKIGRQMRKDYVVHPLLSGPVRSCTPLAANVDRQPGPQRVDALGDHVRSLPRGRRDLRRPRSRARPAASGTCGRCSARPTSPAARRCT